MGSFLHIIDWVTLSLHEHPAEKYEEQPEQLELSDRTSRMQGAAARDLNSALDPKFGLATAELRNLRHVSRAKARGELELCKLDSDFLTQRSAVTECPSKGASATGIL